MVESRTSTCVSTIGDLQISSMISLFFIDTGLAFIDIMILSGLGIVYYFIARGFGRLLINKEEKEEVISEWRIQKLKRLY